MENLSFLSLAYNHFTGPAAGFNNTISILPYGLTSYNISNNSLVGTLPELQYLYGLSYLALGNNLLTGTIPASYSDLSSLQYMYLQNNTLVGTLPLGLDALTELKVFVLANNRLTGSLDDVFRGDVLLNLNTIDIGGNAFTGRIPSTIFQLPSLQRLIMGKNCFSGTIPSTICNATSLIAIQFNNMAGLYFNTVNASTLATYHQAAPPMLTSPLK